MELIEIRMQVVRDRGNVERSRGLWNGELTGCFGVYSIITL